MDAKAHPLPGLAGVYHGREAVLGWWREWLGAWEAGDVEYRLVDAGNRVVGLFDQRMRARSTGIEVATGKFAVLFTFRHGLIVHAKFYRRWPEALAAAGVS